MFDVAVIGGGVTGAAVARELSKYALRVIVLEKGADVAVGASKANSAIVHAGYDCVPGTLKARLNVRGNALLRELCPQLGVPFMPIGSLVVAFNADDQEELGRLLERGRANGVPGLEILDGDEVRRREPNLSAEIVAALWAPSGAIVCPFELTLGFMENAVANGVTFRRGFEVRSVERDERGFTLSGAACEQVRARFVVNAAGIRSDEVNALAGGRPFTILPRKGEYMLLDRSTYDTVGTVVFQTPSRWGKGVLVSPTVHGNLYAGPTAVNTADKDDTAVTPEGLWYLKKLSRKSVPGIPLNKVITSFAGLRSVVVGRDDFIIGREPDVPGWVNAAGICSPGLSSSPAVAELVALELQASGLELTPKADFIATRQRHKHFADMSDDERRAAIAENPLHGRVICRCETVTEAEIVRALHAPVPATTLDGLKRRTRAQAGRCQGGFCGPRLMEIICRETGCAMEDITKNGGQSFVASCREGL